MFATPVPFYRTVIANIFYHNLRELQHEKGTKNDNSGPTAQFSGKMPAGGANGGDAEDYFLWYFSTVGKIYPIIF